MSDDIIVCEKCGKEIDGNFGSGRFCSRKCANSRIFSEESKEKKSLANKQHFKEFGRWGNCCGWAFLSKEQKKEVTKKILETKKNELLTKDFNLLSYERKRKRVIIEQDYKCYRCGLDKWQGEKLSLEIEHVNGDGTNDNRENLIALCPNCHSLTKTWRGRNKCKRKGLISGKDLYDIYCEKGNIRQTLIAVGLVPRGANYLKVKRAIETYQF